MSEFTPITNIIQSDSDATKIYTYSYCNLCSIIPSGFKNKSDYLTTKLGKKDIFSWHSIGMPYVKTKANRWTHKNVWQAWVDTRGLSFEVNGTFTKEQALAAWNDFRTKVGVTK